MMSNSERRTKPPVRASRAKSRNKTIPAKRRKKNKEKNVPDGNDGTDGSDGCDGSDGSDCLELCNDENELSTTAATAGTFLAAFQTTTAPDQIMRNEKRETHSLSPPIENEETIATGANTHAKDEVVNSKKTEPKLSASVEQIVVTVANTVAEVARSDTDASDEAANNIGHSLRGFPKSLVQKINAAKVWAETDRTASEASDSTHLDDRKMKKQLMHKSK